MNPRNEQHFMEKGYREKLKTTNGGRIYIVKRKKWQSDTMTTCYNFNVCKDTFIFGQPKVFKELHKGYWWRKVQFLHELGHLITDWPTKYLNERMATIKGFFRYRKLFSKTSNLQIKHLLRFLWHQKTNWR